MEAPDKIFLPRFVYEKWIYKTSDPDDATEVKYIRKDALMEWANKMLQDTADRLDFHSNQAFAQLFDKLNSM